MAVSSSAEEGADTVRQDHQLHSTDCVSTTTPVSAAGAVSDTTYQGTHGDKEGGDKRTQSSTVWRRRRGSHSRQWTCYTLSTRLYRTLGVSETLAQHFQFRLRVGAGPSIVGSLALYWNPLPVRVAQADCDNNSKHICRWHLSFSRHLWPTHEHTGRLLYTKKYHVISNPVHNPVHLWMPNETIQEFYFDNCHRTKLMFHYTVINTRPNEVEITNGYIRNYLLNCI